MTYERTHIDLFTGLAGFSLAARANGVRTVAMCESDPRCQAFLAKAWPGIPVWPDVRTFSLADALQERRGSRSKAAHKAETGVAVERHAAQVWLLTAGVPCQPASRAGKQRGASDDRWLWKEAVSVFAAVRPAWGLFENPPGIGDVGLAGILSDLGREGYAVRVFSLGACALGAPHRRMRYWIVCKQLDNSAGGGLQSRRNYARESQEPEPFHRNPQGMAHAPQRGQREHGSASGDAGHADECGQGGLGNAAEHEPEPRSARTDQRGRVHAAEGSGPWSNYVWLPCADGKVRRSPDDTQRMVDGVPVELLEGLASDIETQLKKGDHFTPHRSLLGALGNSIVWPIAAKLIEAMIRSEQK